MDFLNKVEEFFAKSVPLRSLRNGLSATLPLLIIGSVFMIIASLPTLLPFIPAYSEDVYNFLYFPYTLTNGIIGLAAVVGITYYHSKTKKLNQLLTVIIAVTTFLLITNTGSGNVVDSTYLGSAGLFTGMIVAFGVTWILSFFKDKKIEITMPESVPSAVAGPFNYMISGGAAVLCFYLLNACCKGVTGVIFPELIVKLLAPLFKGANTLAFMVGANVFINLMWFFGVHGFNIISAVLIPVLIGGLTENATAAASGIAPTSIVTFSSFLMAGNIYLHIPLLFMTCKSEQLKAVGKVSLVPALFNISEPIVFGAPIVGNITLFIPWLLYIGVNAAIVYLATQIGFLNYTTSFPSNLIPHPIFGFIATQDWKVFIVFALEFAASWLIWLPFVRKYDKQLLEQEKEGKAAE